MNLRGLTLIFALLFSGVAGAADPAGTIYKGVDERGQTVFSNIPKGLKNPVKVSPSAPAIVGVESYTVPAKAAPSPTAPSASAPAAPQGKSPVASDAKSDEAKIDEAKARLDRAKAAVEAGKEPVEGERLGTATGGNRLAEKYFERQEILNRELDEAKKAYDKTLER